MADAFGKTPTEARKLELEFIRWTGAKIKMGAVASQRTTFGIGGPLEFLTEPQNERELALVLDCVQQLGGMYHILGAGSAVLIDDLGVPGWTLSLGKDFRVVAPAGGNRITVGAGVSLMTLSRDMSESGYAGLEFAAGIPGTVGGAIKLNASAHGYDMASILHSVTCMTPTGEIVTYTPQELNFSYRRSTIPDGLIIIRAVLNLTPSKRALTTGLRNDLLAERKKRCPIDAKCGGPVFRDPAGKSAATLIDMCGLRGCAIGGAQVSLLDAGWIVNESRNATCDHVTRLIKVCQDEVKSKLQVELETDLVLWIFHEEETVYII